MVNQPPRGLGARTVDLIRGHAQEHEQSLYAAALSLLNERSLSPRADKSLRAFYEVLDQAKQMTGRASLAEQLQWTSEASGLLAYYTQNDKKYGQTNVDNLGELIAFADEFESLHDDEEQTLLETFLAHTALAGDSRSDTPDADCVQIMTMHSAKGMEFPFVMMIGMRDGLCPHIRAFEEAGGLDEERRLCYVAITRAQEQLLMTMAPAAVNSHHNRPTSYRHSRASRFLGDIPSKLLLVRYEDEDGTIRTAGK